MSKKRLAWSQVEIEELCKLYPIVPTKDIALKLDRPYSSVHAKARSLGIKGFRQIGGSKERRRWTNEEIKDLLTLYPIMSAQEIATKLNRTIQAVHIKAIKLNVKADIFSPTRNIPWRHSLSEAHKGIPQSAETCRKHSTALKGPRHPMYGKHWSHDYRIKLSLAHKGQHSSPATEFQNLPYEKRIEIEQKSIHSRHKRPTIWESRAQELIEKACPREYQYTGDGSMMINYLNPDFTNRNGKKKVIEIFGDYWHRGKGLRRWHQTELGRIMAYNSMGFDCLILWASELKNETEAKLVAKIQRFNTKVK